MGHGTLREVDGCIARYCRQYVLRPAVAAVTGAQRRPASQLGGVLLTLLMDPLVSPDAGARRDHVFQALLVAQADPASMRGLRRRSVGQGGAGCHEAGVKLPLPRSSRCSAAPLRERRAAAGGITAEQRDESQQVKVSKVVSKYVLLTYLLTARADDAARVVLRMPHCR